MSYILLNEQTEIRNTFNCTKRILYVNRVEAGAAKLRQRGTES